MKFDWNLAKTLLAVADEGSLSAAARVLGQTQPTVSRQIATLEDSLGVTLFERTGWSVELTGSGAELVGHMRTMAIGANMVSLAASGQSQSVEGLVRITASELFSAYVLPPILADLHIQAPSLEIDVVADNGVRDIARREADIAIRHVRPDQPNLVAKRVRDEALQFYANHTYLEGMGQPTVSNISSHQIISYIDPDRMLAYLQPLGLDLTRANFRLSASSQLVALEMARRGLGLIIAPNWVETQVPELLKVMLREQAFSIPTWLVTHREMKTSRRIRLVFDRLADKLA